MYIVENVIKGTYVLSVEGSGGSGDYDDDDDAMLVTETTTSGPPDPTVASSVITYVTSTVMPDFTSTEGTNPSIPVERLCIFLGVLFVLVVLAVGICIYVKYFHQRNAETTTKPAR